MAEEPESDFGTFLRQARERRGMSLQQVAATTKISARVLGALEHNDPSKLPGGIFARAFVRSYAREVGLDPEATVARFIAAFPEAAAGDEGPVTTSGEDPTSFESGRRVAMTILQLVGISVLVLVAILVYLKMRPGRQAPAPAPTPEQHEPTPAASPTVNGSDALPGLQGAGLSPASSPAASVPAGGDQPSATAGSQAGAPLSIVLVATEQCWVSLTVDGSEAVSRLLEAGGRVEYDAQSSITLKAGNAGALQLTLNGHRGRPLGSHGQVITRTITPDTVANFIEQ